MHYFIVNNLLICFVTLSVLHLRYATAQEPNFTVDPGWITVNDSDDDLSDWPSIIPSAELFSHTTGPYIYVTKLVDGKVYPSWIRKNPTDWEIAKANLTELNFHKKRPLYLVKKYTRWRDLIRWDIYFEKDKKRLKLLYIKNEPKEKPSPLPLPCQYLNIVPVIWRGNITELETHAIVTEADESLMGGDGVDAFIHKAAGPLLDKECAALNGCKVGEAKLTGGYNLPAKYIVHTVVPRDENPDLLMSCYNNSLEAAATSLKINYIAFPCLGTRYGYPKEKAAHIALRTVRSYLRYNYPWIHQVVFVMSDDEDVKIYETLLQLYFPFNELYY